MAHCPDEELALLDNLTAAAQVVCEWLIADALDHAPPDAMPSSAQEPAECSGGGAAPVGGRRVAVVLQTSHAYKAVKLAWRCGLRALNNKCIGVRAVSLYYVRGPRS